MYLVGVFLGDLDGFGEIDGIKCGIDVDEVTHQHIPARYGIVVLLKVAVQDRKISLHS
jgi:hypothetical protein